jgi:hypothetical protein
MKTLKYKSLVLGALIGLAACQDPDDHITTHAFEGGLLEPAPASISFVVNATPSLDVALNVPVGAAIQSVEVYKYFCSECGSPSTAKESNEVFAGTIEVGGANANGPVLVKLPQTYTDLSEGIVLEGSPLPTDEGDLIIGDFWEYRFVSVMADGKKIINNNTVTVSVANQYSGEYQSVGKFIHPTAGERGINRAKTLAPIDINTVETEFADLGGNGWTMRLQVDPADYTVTIIPTGNASGGTVPNGENYFVPATDTEAAYFILNYKYAGAGGDRVVSEKVTKLD